MGCYINNIYDNRLIFDNSWIGLCCILLATDSSLRRIIAKSPQKEYDFLKSLGRTEVEHIVTDKVDTISKQVYNKIQYDNLFAISSEPSNIQEYIKEVLSEAWRTDPGLFRKAEDNLPSGNHG